MPRRGGKVDAFSLVADGLSRRQVPYRVVGTWKGALLRREDARVQDGKLRLEFPGLKTDAAIKSPARVPPVNLFREGGD